MTPHDDQTPWTSPTPAPHPLDDRLPPSLFAPPGQGSPPPLFGGTGPAAAPPDGGGAGTEAPPPVAGGADRGRGVPPPLFRPVADPAPAPDGGRPALPLRPQGAGTPPGDGTAAPAPPRPAAPVTPAPSPRPGPPLDRGGDRGADRGGDRPPTVPPAAPAPAAAPDRDGPGRPTAERPAAERPTAERPTAERPTAERPAPGCPAPGRPVPLDGNLHLKPVRRARAEPSAEWTPLPSYGAGPGGAKPEGGKGGGRAPEAATSRSAERAPRRAPAGGPVDDPGPDTELDLVLDLSPGDRAASATFSVPGPAPAATTATGVAGTTATTKAAATAAATPGTAATTTATITTTVTGAAGTTAATGAAATTASSPARRHSLIANETTASIPLHLLFRDDQEPGRAATLPPGVLRRPVEGRAPATRRPPVPRAPQTRVRPSTRPAPEADPRLVERPGPALPGSAALLAGAAAIAGVLAVLGWRGVLPAAWQTAVGITPRPDLGIGAGEGALLTLLAAVALLALGGLGRGRVGSAWVLTLFGDYRGSVRRTGLVWVSPLLLRRRVDVRLRHWRSEPLPAVDATGTALRVVVLVVWRIKDTVRAALGIEDHEAYLSAQVEAALARVLSQLPADAFHEDAPSLRDAEAVGDALTRLLKAECEPVGVEVYSAQPTGIEYAPEVAAAMQRRRIAAIDAKHRDSVLTSVVDAVDDTVNRLTTRGIVELDDYERKALVKDLTVAFYTGRSAGGDGA
ncbi:SPFH domain-containing protein [Streptomyces sp. DH8]|uniref:SPFH domain-containing protein n=1 Tax=Streptomyces sp. DH8 TaxID=2857008 RepID=UPI001E53DF6C|nr:SPFH domain-containing protein [Streptomyces sp. DH8]